MNLSEQMARMLSAVFDESDGQTTTYRDVAPPEMPDLLSQNDAPPISITCS